MFILKDKKTVKIIFKRELHGILCSFKNSNKGSAIKKFCIIYSPKN